MERNEAFSYLSYKQARAFQGASFIRRWHCNHDPKLRLSIDTVGAHSLRMAGYLVEWRDHGLAIKDALIVAALLHDAHEAVTGDLPYDAPQIIKDARDRVADKFNLALDYPALTEHSANLVKLADRADACLFAASVGAEWNWVWIQAEEHLMEDFEKRDLLEWFCDKLETKRAEAMG